MSLLISKEELDRADAMLRNAGMGTVADAFTKFAAAEDDLVKDIRALGDSLITQAAADVVGPVVTRLDETITQVKRVCDIFERLVNQGLVVTPGPIEIGLKS